MNIGDKKKRVSVASRKTIDIMVKAQLHRTQVFFWCRCILYISSTFFLKKNLALKKSLCLRLRIYVFQASASIKAQVNTWYKS